MYGYRKQKHPRLHIRASEAIFGEPPKKINNKDKDKDKETERERENEKEKEKEE